MKTRNTMGLSILAGGLAFVGSASAVDLMVNGSFEDGVGVGWVGAFGIFTYSAAYYAGPPVPETENPGASYSWRHLRVQDATGSGPLTQNGNLSPTLAGADIDAGRAVFLFSAWMASSTANPERPYVTVQFFDQNRAPLGPLVGLDRTSSTDFTTFADGTTVFDRAAHEHHWAKYVRKGSVPPGARTALAGVTRSPNASVSGQPDTYTDLVKLEVTSVTMVTPPLVNVTPARQTERVGNTVFFSSSIFGLGPFTYQWQFNGANLTGATADSLARTDVQTAQSGAYALVVGYTGGAITSAPVTLTVLAPAYAPVIGQWDFLNEDFRATCGYDLEPAEGSVAIGTYFGDSDLFLTPPLGGLIDGQSVKVMSFPGLISAVSSPGYKMRHGLGGTAGGGKVNRYTLIADVLYPLEVNNTIRSLLQTHPENLDNADIYLDEANSLGVSGVFQGDFQPDTWHRVAVAVDLAGPGPNPIMTKFIDGVKVGQQTLTEGLDGRWSLSADPAKPWALLFADDDGGVQRGYVSSIQLRDGRLSDAEILHLGGTTAGKIAGCISSRREAGSVVIRWTGGVPLQSANAATGPWLEVMGATSPYPVPAPLGTKKFYRPKP